MFEPGTRLFEVQFRRYEYEVGSFSLHARNEADAIASALVGYGELTALGWPISDPLENPHGLEARVGVIGEPSNHTQTVFGEWGPVPNQSPLQATAFQHSNRDRN